LDGQGVNFGAALSPEVLRKAADGIQIIHEDVAKNPQFQRAHELLNNAERVCFLGFGYDRTNLERLAKYTPPPGQEVIGSAKGLTPRECHLIRETLTNLGFPAPGLVDTLRPLEFESLNLRDGLDHTYGEAMQFLRYHCPLD
jgi:hypothetical protein